MTFDLSLFSINDEKRNIFFVIALVSLLGFTGAYTWYQDNAYICLGEPYECSDRCSLGSDSCTMQYNGSAEMMFNFFSMAFVVLLPALLPAALEADGHNGSLLNIKTGVDELDFVLHLVLWITTVAYWYVLACYFYRWKNKKSSTA